MSQLYSVSLVMPLRVMEIYRIKVRVYKKVVSKITNRCVGQLFVIVVIVIVVSVMCEQWHKSSENYKESLIETKHIFVFTLVKT